MSFWRSLKDLRRRIYKHPRPSLFDIDQKLQKYLDFPGGFFIEAGANDGYAQSNTYYLEKKRNWRGLLVEGIPELYAECKKERPNSIVRNVALVDPDYEQTHVTMHFANLMSVVEGSLKESDAQAQHIKRGVEIQGLSASYSVEVPACTLESLLDEIPDLPAIDFFSLDVEGFELNVLKGLNLSRHRPTYVLVEARFFEEIHAHLAQHGYSLIEQLTEHDYLYACT